MLKKSIATIALLTIVAFKTYADEGMWLVNLLDKQLYAQMKAKGLKLSANEIYNDKGGAISDAIVAIDGGSCSGSIISAEGLMITNHHCAYGDVHKLSTKDKNYLEDGFWAMTRDQEVPIKGKQVTFLRRVIDVTDETNRVIDSLDKAGPRGLFFMNKVSGVFEKRYSNQPYEVALMSMWRGSKYYLYFYETYKDIRLVGAPPVSIGAFGGETDNWGWPQHKGDFAMYRVYANKEGKPAEYSKDNVPLKAAKYLTVSSKGVNKDDFTMVLGYPGSTNRYTSSFELKEKYEILNPVISGIRRAKLEVWKKYMDASPAVRLKYADKYFGISNYTDYAKWENICIGRYKIISEIEKREKELQAWIAANPERVAKYGKVIENLKNGYASKAEITRIKENFRESMVRGAEFVAIASRMNSMASSLKKGGKTKFSMEDKSVAEYVNKFAAKQYEESDIKADRELFKVMLGYYLKNVPSSFYDKEFKKMAEGLGNDPIKIADYVYDNSIITDSLRLRNFFNSERTIEELLADPVITVVKTTGIIPYNKVEDRILDSLKVSLGKEKTLYTKALYEMYKEKGKAISPDANSTMRVTFGEVGPIEPADGIYYHYQTTTKGIEEKYDPKNYEFNLKPEMQKKLETSDWGRWGKNGKLYVNFLADMDITGGNSGSAVLNGSGELIGLAFDGNRESMSGDVFFKEGYCKSVCVDIRYVMWVIEKYAGASNIIKELKINDK